MKVTEIPRNSTYWDYFFHFLTQFICLDVSFPRKVLMEIKSLLG